MTHEFKPGDKVKHAQHGECEFIKWDEGRALLRRSDSQNVANVRPSELTPADPGPDAATLLVRELCAAECPGYPMQIELINHGGMDNVYLFTAFAKYIRANPPQPLTVEALRRAMILARPNLLETSDFEECARGGDRIEADAFLDRLYAALTEPRS